jgi:hypothetical protein
MAIAPGCTAPVYAMAISFARTRRHLQRWPSTIQDGQRFNRDAHLGGHTLAPSPLAINQSADNAINQPSR